MEESVTRRRILIIEDNPGDLVLIDGYLQEAFWRPEIEHATTFMAASARLKKAGSFDIILLDLSLPDASGEYLVNEMVKLAGTTPVIVLTGYSDKGFGFKTLALGIFDYLLKDELNGAELYKSIAYSIERSRIINELKESEENYRNLFNLSPVPMWVYNWETAKFLNVNKAAIEHFGYSKKEFLSMSLFDISYPEDIGHLKKILLQVSSVNSHCQGIFRQFKKNGELIDVEIHSDVYSLENKSRLVLANDITESAYQKRILALEKEVYKLHATANTSFKEVVDSLTTNLERILPGAVCTILEKKENDTIQCLSGGSMPAAYLAAIEGTAISASAGPCGAAMYNGENSIATNIGTDPIWKSHCGQIQAFGFLACWSVPIKKSDGKVLGSFAAYFKTEKYPEAKHINLLERTASLAGILIENNNAIEDIKRWNERYDSVAKATSDVIWDWDIKSNKIFWNKGLSKILGYHELNNTTSTDWWKEKINADDVARVMQKIYLHIAGKIINWQDEYRFLCADGSYKYILDKGFLVLNKNNEADRMIGAMQDITRQKEEEHRLKLLESVITNTSDAVVITNVNYLDEEDHTIIYTNEAFTKMTGYTKEEIIGKTPSLFQGPKTNRQELKRLKKAIKKWEACEIEVVNYKKNGTEFWNNIAISPVADSTGAFTHWIAIERDVTIRKMRDQEITKAIINAQEVERFQIGGELHDNVNQILAGVLLNLGMTKGKPLTEQAIWIDNSLEYIHLAIQEIRKLSHTLAPVSFEENSLKDTFQKLLKSINVDNRFTINFFIDKVDYIKVDSDIQLNLYRILQEQVNNIMKYSKATVIEITLVLINNNIHLRIYDNGIGFDTQKNRKGIGFNNIKKRAELFSGHFALKSSVGKGCELIIEIPLK